MNPSALTRDSGTAPRPRWPDLVLLCWPGWIACFIFPSLIFSRNQAGFYYEVSTLVPCLAAGAAWTLVALLAGIMLQAGWRRGLAQAGLLLGLWLLLKDYVAPVHVSNLIGYSGNESAEVTGTAIALEAGLTAGLAVLAWRLRGRDLVRPAAVFAIALGAAQFAIFAWDLTPAARSGLAALVSGRPAKWLHGTQPAQAASSGNIYHLVVDGYAAHSFPDALKLNGFTAADWPGFTYFRRNWANYDVTHPSVASFLSGSLFPGGDLRAWKDEQARHGLFAQLIEGGYRVWLYPSNDHYDRHPFSERRIFPSRSTLRRRLQLADLVVLRLAPSFIKGKMFADGRGAVTRAYVGLRPQNDQWISTWVTLASPAEFADYFRALVADEQDRPASGQYVYMHLYLPHGPFELDRQARPRGTPLFSLEDLNAPYREQAAGVNVLLQSFLRELKRLGRYDNSTILIHADHGLSSYPSPEPLPWTPEDNEAVMKVSLEIGHVLSIEPAVAALLLFKPAGAPATPMLTSDRLTQLLDIPATIYSTLGWPATAPAGRSILSPDYPAAPERSVFFGYMQRRRNQILWFGKDIRSGAINHFSWSPTNGWHVYPNLDATWR